jgi:hypothetical protein
MPGPLLHVNAVYMCPHGGNGQIVSTNTKVLVSGNPVALVGDTYTIAGCTFQVPVGAGTKPQPCTKVQWMTPATRVTVNGSPPLLATSQGLAQSADQIPAGPPTVTTTQTRVTAT